MPTNYWLKFGNTPLGYNGSGVQYTHVEQPGQLVISLNGIGTGFDTAKNFNVLVTFGSAISYTVDGTPVATPSATCTLTLHAGQVSVVGNIPFGTTFVISETVTDEGYELQSITVPSGTMTDGGTIHSVVNNVYHAPGTLTVGVSMSGSGYDPTKTFGFVVTFGRAISYSVNGTPVSSPTNTYSGSLASGGSVVLGNIPSGVSYSVVEQAISDYDSYMGYSNGSVTGGSGVMTDGGSVSATAAYTYSYGLGALDITLSTSIGTDVVFSRAGYFSVNGVQEQTAVKSKSNLVAGTYSFTDCPSGDLWIEIPRHSTSRLYRIECTWKDSSGTVNTQAFTTTFGSSRTTAHIYCYPGYTATVSVSQQT